MRFIFKIIYYSCCVYIAVILLVLLALRITPLDFARTEYSDYFDTLFFAGIPVAILLTITRLGFRQMDKAGKRNAIIKTLFLSVGTFLLFIFYAAVTWADGLCHYSEGPVLFINRSHPSTRIIARYYGCGAVDSSPASPSAAIRKPFTPFFAIITRIDTSKLDLEKWKRVGKE